MIEVKLRTGSDHIDLCDLLKLAGVCENGAAAKHTIAAGEVKLDGQIELRKRAKILKDQIVEFDGKKIKVVAAT